MASYLTVKFGIHIQHIEELNVIDHMILKTILGAQSKVPTETLYLETGALSIKHVISVRRMLYLKHILNKHENEVVRKVYTAMKSNPLRGDWYKLVEADFKNIGMELNEKLIEEANITVFKTHIKKNVWSVFYNELEEKNLKHTKVQTIKYDGVRRPQSYLTSPNFDNEMSSLLFNLCCKSVNTFRDNFHTMYGKEPACRLCNKFRDSQEHALDCFAIKEKLSKSELSRLHETEYSQLFGNIEGQENITKMYQIIIAVRDKTLGLPGLLNSGPD